MFLNTNPLRLSVLAAALASALPALAQQAAPAAAAPMVTPKATPAAPDTMQKVEVKGSVDAYDARRDDTASKIVLNHEEIVKYGDTNVLDVLKRLPGVTVAGASGRGGEVRMRGLGNGYTQILVNGERAPAGFSMDSLAPDAIERIEVLRAATAEFSTQSIAGTINIVLKKAIKTAQRELKLSIGGGRDTVTPTANLQLSDRKGKLSYSLSMNAVHSGFDRDTPSVETFTNRAGATTAVRSSSFHEKGSFDGINIGPRLNWTFENGDTLTSQSFINYGRFSRTSETVVAAVPASAAGDNPYLDWDMTNVNLFFRTDLNWVKKLDAGAKLDMKIGGVVGALRNDSYRQGYTEQDGDLTLDNYVKSRGTDRGFTSTGKYSRPLGEGHALAAGWDVGLSNRDDSRVQRERRYGDVPPDLALREYEDFPLDQQFDGDVTRVAAFVQDEWNVTPRWSVYMGVRWEGIRSAVTGNDFDATKTRTSVWSPLFQTLYKLPDTKGDQLRFALTRTYKAPNIQSVIPRRFTSGNNSASEPDFIGNPLLKPELATGVDASYEHYWGKGSMVSVSGSVRRITDYTRNRIDQEADDTWIQFPDNDGSATTRGLEFEAKFPLTSLFAAAPALDMRINLSRNWSSVSNVSGPNNRLDQQTPFSSTLAFDYKSGNLSTGASYSFRTGGPVRISDTQSAYSTARRDLEMFAVWKFDPKNQLRVGLTNLLAQDYVTENSYTFVKTGGAVRRTTTTPGEAQLRLTMEMKF
jgi:outer membrane receptor for ferrienterochelin and colicins